MTKGQRGTVVDRPLWRSFSPKFVGNAIRHARRGGFSAIMYEGDRIKLLLPRRRNGELAEMSLWALLSLDIRRWGSTRTGPARGLAAIHVKPEDRETIRAWCKRDAVYPGIKHTMVLDCLACGACCRDNHVVLEREDIRAFGKAGRPELAKPPYTRTSRGSVVLRLAPSGACQHLGKGNLCAIYPIRPGNCSTFPVGAEPCMSAREETLGILG